MCNVICCCFFALFCGLSALLKNRRGEGTFLRVSGAILFLYKAAFYVMKNLRGEFIVPVEISAISYFLIPLIIIFQCKKLYNVGAFFGILAGIGYFTFYTVFGSYAANLFSVRQGVIGCFCHGYLFLAGRYLFRKNAFALQESYKIWIAVLAMCGWALLFLGTGKTGTVFLYYILRPDFLFAEAFAWQSVLLLLGYYALLAAAFYGLIRLFYAQNGRIFRRQGASLPAQG